MNKYKLFLKNDNKKKRIRPGENLNLTFKDSSKVPVATLNLVNTNGFYVSIKKVDSFLINGRYKYIHKKDSTVFCSYSDISKISYINNSKLKANTAGIILSFGVPMFTLPILLQPLINGDFKGILSTPSLIMIGSGGLLTFSGLRYIKRLKPKSYSTDEWKFYVKSK